MACQRFHGHRDQAPYETGGGVDRLHCFDWRGAGATATDRLDPNVILSAYLVLTGLSRFVEEGMRGEPRTPAWRDLTFY
jgi:hypothetical protein